MSKVLASEIGRVTRAVRVNLVQEAIGLGMLKSHVGRSVMLFLRSICSLSSCLFALAIYFCMV